MPAQTEPKNLRDVLFYEDQHRMSRRVVTFMSGTAFEVGQVLGKDYKAKTNFTQDSGTGLSTGDVSLGQEAKKGDYVIHGTGTDTGYIMDPDGYRVDDFSSLTYAGKHISIDSGTVASDDKYTVTVGDSSGKYVPFDPSATNGAHEPAGIPIEAYDATDGDVEGVAVVRDAVLLRDGLVWPDTITTAQKEAALEAFQAVNIQVKDAA